MMSKEKFAFNPHTLRFERQSTSKRKRVKKFALMGSLMVGAIVCGYLAFYFLHKEPDQILSTKLSVLEKKYSSLNKQLKDMSSSLGKIHQKDAEIYSVMLGREPIDENIWQSGTGGSDWIRLNQNNPLNVDVFQIEEQTEKLSRQIKMQNESLSELYKEAVKKEEMLACIPSVKPVKKEALQKNIHLLSGFGKRLHPVFHVWRMHEGLDFSCPRGTHIIASGNGVVESINGKGSGFGKHVYVNHGYGYHSLYAHMSEVKVKVGQKVDRGTLLGYVGATGTATAPHLHYEIHKDGKAIDPIAYVLDGLTPQEYQDMVRQASIEGKSMD